MSTTTATKVETIPYLCGGEWRESATGKTGDVFNPSTGGVIAKVPYCSVKEAEDVVKAAADAQFAWGETPVIERVRVLYKFREKMLARADDIAKLITREHGKTAAEARAEVQRGLEVVEFATGMPSLLMGTNLTNIARSVDCETIRHPLGVVVGITPFNFPSMVPLWMFPVAIACGNAFILKPSERVPLSANLLGEMLTAAGLPAGVFNIVHGDKEVVDVLLKHPSVKAISFVGSTTVAKYIYETGTKHGKRVQSAGGAKNHLLIMPDADLDQAALALQASAFGCAGERCMAGSVAVPVGKAADPLLERLTAIGSKMKTGRTDTDATVDMGPVITRAHQQRVMSYMDIAQQEGATVALDGRQIDAAKTDGFFVGPSIVDRVAPEMRLAKDEIFGPVLSVIRVDDLDHALRIGKQCQYGNGASIFTKSGWAARQFKQYFNAGMIGINIGVPAPMAWFPFAGWNDSFFGDLHIQGTESIHFYTQVKTITTRWFESADESHHDPVWKTQKV